MEINDARKPGKYQFKEFAVLSSVIYLMLLSGITVAVELFMIDKNTFDTTIIYQLHGYCQKLIPAIATLPTAILSELIGRKPSLNILAAASIVSSVLHAFPTQETCLIAGFVLQGVVKGGVFITTFLVISEIASPRYRFAYLIANMTAFNVGFGLTSLRFWMELWNIGPVFVVPKQVVQVIQVVLGVVCLGVVSVGLESPYWLARRGRVEESRRALLWLRGEGCEAELSSVLQQPQRSGSPRLFWLPLLAGISAISVNIISSYLTFTTTAVFNIMLHFQLHDAVNLVFAIVFIPIVTTLTYNVYHRSLFLVASVIILALSYAFAIWLYFVHGWFSSETNEFQIFDFFVYSCNTILTGGPCVFGVVLCTRVIPAKCNLYIVSVCFIYFHLMGTIQGLINVSPDPRIFGLAILETTLSLCCAFGFYFLLPESKYKMVLERPEQRY